MMMGINDDDDYNDKCDDDYNNNCDNNYDTNLTKTHII